MAFKMKFKQQIRVRLKMCNHFISLKNHENQKLYNPKRSSGHDEII